MAKVNLQEQLARDIAAPIILNLLKPYSAQHMNYAITHNVNLAKALGDDPEYLNQIRSIVYTFPFADEAAKQIPKEKWIQWFINNEMLHKRGDLYPQVAYHPQGFKYITKQVRNIVKLVFQW